MCEHQHHEFYVSGATITLWMVRKLITHGKYKYKMNLVVVGSEHGARLIYTIIFLLLS